MHNWTSIHPVSGACLLVINLSEWPGYVNTKIFAGEMFDLEALSTTCKETGRYTFFFSSWPLNVWARISQWLAWILILNSDTASVASRALPMLRWVHDCAGIGLESDHLHRPTSKQWNYNAHVSSHLCPESKSSLGYRAVARGIVYRLITFDKQNASNI